MVAANHGVRAEGIPTLALFEQLMLFKQAPDAAARLAAMPKQEGIFTITDPEIDAMRNGNVDSGLKASHINGMVAYFPEFCRVKFMEDNQATSIRFCPLATHSLCATLIEPNAFRLDG